MAGAIRGSLCSGQWENAGESARKKERESASARKKQAHAERESWRAGETERRESRRAGDPSERVRKRKPQLTRAAAFILAAGAGGSCRSAVRSRAMQPRPLPSQEAMQLRPHLEEREGRDRERGRGRRRKSKVRRVAAALESREDWGFGSREMKTCLVGEGRMGCLMG